VQENKAERKKEQLQTLHALIGEEIDPEFLRFVIDKYEGENIETIANNLFDPPNNLKILQDEFKDSKFEKEEIIIEVENPKEKTQNFGTLLVHHKEILEMVLQCLKLSQNKAGGWAFIKKLPLNEEYVSEVSTHLDSGRWEELFGKRETEHAIYIIHIISNHLKQYPDQVTVLFGRKGLRVYLLNWLSQVVRDTPEEISSY
jgi:hypothetical protein